MLANALAFLIGGLVLISLPALPPAASAWLLLPLALAWRTRKRPFIPDWLQRSFTLLFVLALGFAWSGWTAGVLQSQWLAPELEDVPLQITGTVVDLPRHEQREFGQVSRFEFAVEEGLDARRIRLAAYDAPIRFEAGQRWQLTVKLRRPHGSVNVAGFDYERWLFQRGIGAVGRVLLDPEPGLLSDSSSLDGLRSDLAAKLSALTPSAVGQALIPALTVGDRRGLGDAQWEVLQVTGTSHLIAISGLHIGLVAALGLLLGRALCFLIPALALHLTAPRAGAVLGLLLAIAYAALAGFSLPTVRALIMLVVVLGGLLFQRATRPGRSLGLALFAVLLTDPLAPLSGGFWLSFAAVAALLAFAHRPTNRAVSGQQRVRAALSAQWAISLMLLPLVAFFFQQTTLISPLVNLLAIPITGLLLVPMTLIGVLLVALSEPLAAAWFTTLDYLLQQGFAGLEWAASLPGVSISVAQVPVWAVVLAVGGGMLMLLPGRLPIRWLGPVFALPLFFPPRAALEPGQLRMHVFDVGQGLAVLVQTHQHALLFDTGPRYPSGFDTGEAVLLPGLARLGVTQLDRVILSHGDNDHAGGYAALARQIDVGQLMTSDQQHFPAAQPCVAGQSWQWDGVTFDVLHPMPGLPYLGNDSSCVLRVRAGGASLLLPGDITEVVERRLVKNPRDIDIDVLIAPHHGSKTSSGAAFVRATSPSLVVFSTGYRNRFGMPGPQVSARYQQQLAETFDTAQVGAIEILIEADGRISRRLLRDSPARIWRPPRVDQSSISSALNESRTVPGL